MNTWIIICKIEECINLDVPSTYTTETNDVPEVICGACGKQYTDITLSV